MKFKKLLSAFIGATVAVSSVAALGAEILYESKTITPITLGVTRTEILRMQTDGWQNINIIEADLSYEHLSFKPLRNQKGISSSQSVMNMAKDNGAIAAINADFFDTIPSGGGKLSPIGMFMEDGALVSTPSHDGGFSTIIEDTDGNLAIDYFTYYYKITSPSGAYDWIRSINKYPFTGDIVYLDKNWGEYSLGLGTGYIELVVEDGIVTDKRLETEAVKIPENGYVLCCKLSSNSFLNDYFVVGEEAQIEQHFSPDISSLKSAVGCGTMLIKNGESAEITHNVAGKNPRSAVGISEDGKKLYLVSVDGRHSDFIGMTLPELRDLMFSLGCYNAANLDGGGSTQLVAKDFVTNTPKLVNKISGTYQRPVVSSVGITSSAEVSELTGIYTKANDENIFTNTETNISVYGYDKYYNLINLEPSNINFTVSGVSGSVENSRFSATSHGKATITASYNGFSSSTTVNVLSDVKILRASLKEANLKEGEQTQIDICGANTLGFTGAINPENLVVTSKTNCAEYKNGKITALSSGSDILTFKYGNAVLNIPVFINSTEKIKTDEKESYLIDEANTNASPDSFSFSVFGSIKKPETMLDIILNEKLKNNIKANDAAVFLGEAADTNGIGSEIITADEYKKITKNGNTMIFINTDKGGILKTDSGAWKKFENDINTLETKNLFIFLSSPSGSYGFKYDNELSLFQSRIEDSAEKGHNIYVVHPGDKCAFDMINGVKYLSISSIPEMKKEEISERIKDISFYEFSINGDNISYSLKQLY